MAEEKTNIQPISAETLAAIKRKSAYNLPDRPSERGMKPDEIKRAFWAPISDVANSTIAELERVISEANAVLDNLRAGITSLESTLEEDYCSNEEANKKIADAVISRLDEMRIFEINARGIYENKNDIPRSAKIVGARYLLKSNTRFPCLVEIERVNEYSTGYVEVFVKNIMQVNGTNALFRYNDPVASVVGDFYLLKYEFDSGTYRMVRLNSLAEETQVVKKIENTTGGNAVYVVNKSGDYYLLPIKIDPVEKALVQRSATTDAYGDDDSGEIRVRIKKQIDSGELMPKTDYVAICKAQADKLYASKTDLDNALGSYIEEIDTLLGGD